MVTKEFHETLTASHQKLVDANNELAIFKTKLPLVFLTMASPEQVNIHEALNNSSKAEQLTHIAKLTNNDLFTASLRKSFPGNPDLALQLQQAVKAMTQAAQEEAISTLQPDQQAAAIATLVGMETEPSPGELPPSPEVTLQAAPALNIQAEVPASQEAALTTALAQALSTEKENEDQGNDDMEMDPRSSQLQPPRQRNSLQQTPTARPRKTAKRSRRERLPRR